MRHRNRLELSVYIILALLAALSGILGVFVFTANSPLQSLFLNLATELAGAAVIFLVVKQLFGLQESSSDNSVKPLLSRLDKIEERLAGITMLQGPVAALQDSLTTAVGQQLQTHLDELQKLGPPVRRHVFATSDQRKIRDYMFAWIANGGQVAIWTRDHSWVDDQDMRDLLVAKAQKKELIICLPKATPFCEQLKKAGAEVFAYGNIEGLPSTRFTVAKYSRADAAVAIAVPAIDGTEHIIDEYSTGRDAAAVLAFDLVRLARMLSSVKSAK